MTRLPISVLIITYNEEVNIRAVLESVVPWAGEVFVVDSFSNDGTKTICEEYASQGVRVWEHEFENYAAQRNWALRELPWSNEWLFWLDADEVVTPELMKEFETLFSGAGPDRDFYYVKRRLIFLNTWIRHVSSYPLWLLRLFRVKDGSFTRPINEQVIVPGDGGYLEHDLLHDDQKGMQGWLKNHNRYSSLEAEEYLKVLREESGDQQAFLEEADRPDVQRQRKLRRFMRMPCRPLVMFVYLYFVKRGFLDGRAGLIYSLMKAMNQFVISAKMYEIRLNESLGIRSPQVKDEDA